MTNPDFDDLATTTQDNYLKPVKRQFHNDKFMLMKLSANMMTHTGGDQIVEPLLINGNHTHAWYKGYDNLPMDPSEHLTAIRNPWAQSVAVVTFCGAEKKQMRGEASMINLFAIRNDEAIEGVRCAIEEAILFSNGSDPRMMHGLPLLLSDKPYGGIDPSRPGCEFWTPYYCDPRATFLETNDGSLDGFKEPPFTFDNLLETNVCIDNGKSRPDCWVLSKDLYLGLRRWAEGKVTFEKNQKMVDFGIEHIRYLGTDIGVDYNLPDGSGYGLNMDCIKMHVQADCWLSPTGFKTPPDQDASVSHILSMLQLTTNKRSAHAVIRCYKPAC